MIVGLFLKSPAFIELLKKASVFLVLGLIRLKIGVKQQSQWRQLIKNLKVKLISLTGKESFILDGTAASIKQTDNLKKELEEAGYEVFMLYVYTDLERSLKPKPRQI